MDYVMAHSAATATHKVVLLAIAQHANTHNEAWPSLARLSAFAGVSDRSVRNALRDLEQGGELETLPRKGFGRQANLRSNLYRLVVTPCACERTADGHVKHVPAGLSGDEEESA